MRWRWFGVAVLVACSGGDEVVPDAPIGADASSDAMPDAAPMLALGPVQTFDELVPGAAISIGTEADVAWTGSEFVLASAFTYMRIGMDGVPIDVRVTEIPADAIACHESGVCILVDTFLYTNETRFIRIAADGTPIDAAPVAFAMSSDVAPEVGVTEDGFVIATVSFAGVDAVRVGLSGPPLDPVPIELMADTQAAVSTERSAMACDDLGCTIAVRDSFGIDSGPVRLIRLWADGTHDPPVDVPGAYGVGGFSCTAGMCLLVQQGQGPSLGPVEGVLLDTAGVPLAPAFSIMNADDSNYGFDVAADATGFTVTVDHGATQSVLGQARVAHVAFDGSVGPPSDTVPSVYYGASSHSRIACAPTRCMVVSSNEWALYRARVDAGVLIDVAPFHVPAGNGQARVSIATDGTSSLVAWTDYRLGPTRESRAAIWSSTGWASPSSILLPIAAHYVVAWDGGYLVAARNADMLSAVRLAPDGTLIDATPIQTQVSPLTSVGGVACQPAACIFACTAPFRLARLDASGNLALLPASSAITRRASITRFGDHIAVVGQDSSDRAWLSVFTIDGEKLGELDLGTSGSPEIAEIGDHLVAGWSGGDGTYVVRQISSSLVLGPVVEFPIMAISSVRLQPFGGEALLTWNWMWPTTTIYAARLGPDLELLDPTPIAIAEVASLGLFSQHALATSGSTALFGWSSLDDDPSLMTERLAIRSIVVQ